MKDLQPKQLILLHFNDLVENKPLIFSPFQLFDKTLKSEDDPAIADAMPAKDESHSHLDRV